MALAGAYSGQAMWTHIRCACRDLNIDSGPAVPHRARWGSTTAPGAGPGSCQLGPCVNQNTMRQTTHTSSWGAIRRTRPRRPKSVRVCPFYERAVHTPQPPCDNPFRLRPTYYANVVELKVE